MAAAGGEVRGIGEDLLGSVGVVVGWGDFFGTECAVV